LVGDAHFIAQTGFGPGSQDWEKEWADGTVIRGVALAAQKVPRVFVAMPSIRPGFNQFGTLSHALPPFEIIMVNPIDLHVEYLLRDDPEASCYGRASFALFTSLWRKLGGEGMSWKQAPPGSTGRDDQ